MRPLMLVLFLLSSCREMPKESGLEESSVPDDTQVDTQVQAVDADEDGFEANEDCDDADAEVNPGADELCDGIDNDCDGLVDDADDSVGDPSTWYQDLDGDGVGNAGVEQSACEQPVGYVEDGTDCNDLDGAFHPGTLLP